MTISEQLNVPKIFVQSIITRCDLSLFHFCRKLSLFSNQSTFLGVMKPYFILSQSIGFTPAFFVVYTRVFKETIRSVSVTVVGLCRVIIYTFRWINHILKSIFYEIGKYCQKQLPEVFCKKGVPKNFAILRTQL